MVTISTGKHVPTHLHTIHTIKHMQTYTTICMPEITHIHIVKYIHIQPYIHKQNIDKHTITHSQNMCTDLHMCTCRHTYVCIREAPSLLGREFQPPRYLLSLLSWDKNTRCK